MSAAGGSVKAGVVGRAFVGGHKQTRGKSADNKADDANAEEEADKGSLLQCGLLIPWYAEHILFLSIRRSSAASLVFIYSCRPVPSCLFLDSLSGA